MRVMKSAPSLSVSSEQRGSLEKMARSTSLPHRGVVQAKALLWAADGVANEEIARRCGVDSDAVRRWRRRFSELGVAGVGVIAKGRGRRSWLPEGTVAEVVRVTLEETPDDTSTHWTTRSLAKRFGIGKDTVARIWQDHHLQPWKVDTFKISTDPRFEEKLVDVFAALNVATGEVLYDCREHHTGKDVLQFFKLINLHVARNLDIHVVLDNLSAHMGPEVTDWLAHPKRGRWHLHFTPTSSSWLNIIERWFKELTDRRLRRGVFTSVADLIDAIEIWAEHWNHDPEPFIWHKTAEEIITKVRRGRAALHQIKSATHH